MNSTEQRDTAAESANEAKEAKAAAKKKTTASKAAKPKTPKEKLPTEPQKTKASAVAYSKDVDPDFKSMDIAALRDIFKQMERTAIDLGFTSGVAPIEKDASIEEACQTCTNLHNYIKVRSVERVETAKTNKKSKGERQRGAAAPKTNEGEEDMAKKAKKTAAKKTSKASGGGETKWKGYDLTAKITKLKDHALREGTEKAKRWDNVLKCKTIADVKSKKLPVAAVKNMVAAKVIKVG